jgi:endonuclease G, mitochondrial
LRSMLLTRLIVTVGLVAVSAFPAFARSAQCQDLFLASTPPKLTNPKLEAKTSSLCFSEFALLHSGLSRTPVWVAEHLAARGVTTAKDLARPDSTAFHAEPQLDPADRAELADYQRSGYDRGHMAPNGDMSEPKAQDESFSLANIVPQHACNNRATWASIETAVRSLASESGEVFVVTGPAFIGSKLKSLNKRVLVPTHLFKAVYVPARKQAGVYWAPNDRSRKWEPISLSKLEELTGIDVFPKLSADIKRTSMSLPTLPPRQTCRLDNE